MSKNKILPVIFVFSLLINIATFFVLVQNRRMVEDQKTSLILQRRYPLLSKRVFSENRNDALLNFLALRSKLQNQVKPYGDNFGFYFEYLPTGTSIGVNSTNPFYSASLFKVPIVMAYYHFLDRTGNNINESLTIQKDDIDKNFGTLYKKGVGGTISARDAVRLTLGESDNTAAKIIAKRVEKQDFQAVYEALGLDLQTGNGGAILTARDYSAIFKALYFSAVINRNDSNEILDFLAKSKFNDKLVAGVPSKVTVAHKIGDYKDKKGNTEFMDCGIVYEPRRPYMLCMVSLGDEKKAQDRMSGVSKTIYDYVTSAK